MFISELIIFSYSIRDTHTVWPCSGRASSTWRRRAPLPSSGGLRVTRAETAWSRHEKMPGRDAVTIQKITTKHMKTLIIAYSEAIINLINILRKYSTIICVLISEIGYIFGTHYISENSIIFIHLKLWVAVATHNFKWMKSKLLLHLITKLPIFYVSCHLRMSKWCVIWPHARSMSR